ncbi:hypothetical protein [Pseudonocardia acaciae]|uniref:hypothetical protein n=1 Tax=Pseudonocardia acaciae TaxID=551276 RepID=UPI0004913E99|nr:hypothetical protein [Pseudonocardia acaciae]
MPVLGCYWGERNNPRRKPDTGPDAPAYERAPKVADYFRGVSRPPRAIYTLERDWSERAWRKAPVEWVPLDQLHATQDWISVKGLRHHARPGARPDGNILPLVVYYRGRWWLFDGHHRAVCAMDRGERRIEAHVRRPGQVAA